jgi:hypothetical protein
MMTDDQAWDESRKRWPHFGALVARTKEGKCYVSNEYSYPVRVKGLADTWEEAFAIADIIEAQSRIQ